MTKHKVSELEGVLLDAAVAKAEGLEFEIAADVLWIDGAGGSFHPSQDWAHGGPIIEREWIDVIRDHLREDWAAYAGPFAMARAPKSGPTPLIAAMRAYVASKLGEEVELP